VIRSNYSKYINRSQTFILATLIVFSLPAFTANTFISTTVYAAELSSALTSDITKSLSDEINTPVSTSSILQTIIGLVVVLAVIALSAYLLRRFGSLPGMNNGVIKVIATVSMGPRERIILLQAGEQQILVGISPGRMQTLCELNKPVEVSEADLNIAESFQNKLFSAIKGQSAVKKP